MTKPASFRDLIDTTFGGRDRFSRATGIDVAHVDVMKHRNSIAPEHWPAVIQAADRLLIDLTFGDLTLLRAARKSPSRDADLPKVVSAHA